MQAVAREGGSNDFRYLLRQAKNLNPFIVTKWGGPPPHFSSCCKVGTLQERTCKHTHMRVDVDCFPQSKIMDLLILRCKDLSGTWRELGRNGPPPCRPFVEQILVVSQRNCCKLYKRHGVCSSGSVQLAQGRANLTQHSCVCALARARTHTHTIRLIFFLMVMVGETNEEKPVFWSPGSPLLLSTQTKHFCAFCYCLGSNSKSSRREKSSTNLGVEGLSMWIWSAMGKAVGRVKFLANPTEMYKSLWVVLY